MTYQRNIASGHAPFGSCVRTAKSPPRKDAGSVRSRRLRARLRTRRGGGLQPLRACGPGGAGPLSKNGLDDSLPDQVVDPQVEARDRAGDDHDDRSRGHLALIRPLNLAELGHRLADERAALRLAAAGLSALSLLRRTNLSLARASALRDRRVAARGRAGGSGRLLAAHRAALGARCPQRVS